MQSTVFDFTFRLKSIEIDFYMIDSAYTFVEIDFRTAMIKSTSKDFGLSSLFRERTTGDIEYLTIDDYCLIYYSECITERSYLYGKHAYQDMFNLDVDSGFNYSPEFLLTSSDFIDIIVGRGINDSGFFTNQSIFITRGHKYIGISRVENNQSEHLLLNESYVPDLSIDPLYNDWTVFTDTSSDMYSMEVSSIGMVLLSDQSCIEIIENDMYMPIIKYSVKTNLTHEITTDILLEVNMPELFLEGFNSKSSFVLSMEDKKILELSGLTSKYGIIISTYGLSLSGYYSPYSRHTYSKG